MSLQFIFGPAGSGKSSYAYEYIIEEASKNPSQNFFIIVPDQFTMQTQMDIVKKSPSGGIMNIDVLSFSRLIYRVFEEMGKPEKMVLDDTGKSLVLRNVAGKVSEDMPCIGRNLNKIGYIHEVKSSISEFMQYGISVSSLNKLADTCENGLLKMKLRDLSTVYAAFEEYNKDRYITKEEQLNVLNDKLTNSVIFRESTVIFDGFTGFTPIQENVIGKLMNICKRVILTFTLSHGETLDEFGGEEKLFYLSRKSAHRLIKIAQDNGVEREKDIYLNSSEDARHKNNPELAHLEKNLFMYPFSVYENKPENIEIFTASDISGEVDAMCNKIYSLMISGKYKYRDIAVVTGNLESYAGAIKTRFDELGFPCFIDQTSSIILNPYIEYIKSAMQIIIKDYSFDSVFHFLRSGFTGIEKDEIDRFERYIKSLNIRGKKAYHNAFHRLQKDMCLNNEWKEHALLDVENQNETREKLISILAPLEDKGSNVKDYVSSLYRFITNNDSFNKLMALADKFEAANELSKAVEYRQIYRLTMELLDAIVSLLGDETLPYEEFYKIFEAGIAEIKVSTIPKCVDKIVVGDIERTRLNEIKALFFMGVNDMNIPKGTDSGGILSSVERQVLTDGGVDLAPTSREQMYTQRLYLYMNMCKPTEKLFLSFAAVGLDGKGMRPSYLIENVKRLYKDIALEVFEETPIMERIIGVKDSYKYYAHLMRDYIAGMTDESEEALSKALLKLYRDLNDTCYEKMHSGAFFEYEGTPLSQEITDLLYSDCLQGSISRFEKFASCAYAHYLNYGINLKEPGEYEFNRMDMGTVIHAILNNFSFKLEENGTNLKDFDDEMGDRLLMEAINEYCEDYGQGILKEDAQSAYIVNKITELMRRTVKVLKYQVSRGKFVPTLHEYPVDDEYALEGNKKLKFKGKVDRVDLYKTEDKVYVKIIDYKSSKKDIDITEVYYGLQQQLVTYLNTVIKKEEKRNPGKLVLPSAILYYQVDNPYVDAKGEMSDEAIEGEIKKALSLKGMVVEGEENLLSLDENAMGSEASILPVKFNTGGEVSSKSAGKLLESAEAENLISFVENKTVEIANEIIKGEIKASPIGTYEKNSCEYCPYSGVCGFDKSLNGYKLRTKNELTEDEIRNRVLKGVANGEN